MIHGYPEIHGFLGSWRLVGWLKVLPNISDPLRSSLDIPSLMTRSASPIEFKNSLSLELGSLELGSLDHRIDPRSFQPLKPRGPGITAALEA